MRTTSRVSVATLVAVVFSLFAGAARADVLTVGPTGAFADVQTAVDAAADFDVVLVEAGSYGPVDVGDVAVTIVADAGETVTIERVRVHDLSAGKLVALIGLRIESTLLQGQTGLPALEIQDTAGSVRVEQCVVEVVPGATPVVVDVPAVRVIDAADVAFARSTLLGTQPTTTHLLLSVAVPSLPGLEVERGEVVVHGGEVVGTTGMVAFSLDQSPGSPGISVSDGAVFLSGTTVRGGDGLDGTVSCMFPAAADGTDGGVAVALVDASARLRQLDATLIGGTGGEGASIRGTCNMSVDPGVDGEPLSGAGSVLALGGAAHGLTFPAPLREGEGFDVVFAGEPGEQVWLFKGLSAASFFKAGFRGSVLVNVAPPTHLSPIGFVPAGGELSIPVVFPDLGAGLQGITVTTQPVFLNGPEVFFGAPVTGVVLDEAQ